MRNSNPYDVLTDAFDMGYITDWASDYAEPGYTLSEGARGVAFGDWNGKNYRLANILDRMGYEVEWLDEWTRCEHCDRAFRTQPDSYSWKMHGAYLEDSCEMICGDCLAENPEWITDELMNDPRRALTMDIDLAAEGWHMIPGDAWRHGWYGQEDNPEEVVLSHVPENHDYIFVIDSVGQFELAFRLWIREATADSRPGEFRWPGEVM